MTSEAATNYDSNNSDAGPPQLAVGLPSMGDVTTTLKQPDLPVDILLVTVKDCEFLACYNELKDPFRCYFDDLGYVYFADVVGSQPGRVKVALMKCHEGSNGPGGSLTAVRNAARILQPKAVISVGVCSGLNPDKTKLGDVIVSAKLTTYASKVVTSDQEQWAGVCSYVSRRFLNIITNCADGWQPPLKNPEDRHINVHNNGELLSGPEQIRAEWKRKELLERHPLATGVEMEGEGVFTAAFDTHLEWLIVKGIADFANGEQVNAESWEACGSVMAASLVSHILSDPNVFGTWPHYQGPNTDEQKLSKKATVICQDENPSFSGKRLHKGSKKGKRHLSPSSNPASKVPKYLEDEGIVEPVASTSLPDDLPLDAIKTEGEQTLPTDAAPSEFSQDLSPYEASTSQEGQGNRSSSPSSKELRAVPLKGSAKKRQSSKKGERPLSSSNIPAPKYPRLLKDEDVLQLDKLSIVPEPSLKSAYEGESVEGPKDDNSKDPGEVPMATANGMRDIRAATMMFEAKHEECIRVLPYIKDGQFVVQFYVYSGESGIPKHLEEEAQQLFEDMNMKLEWSDLYNDSVNVLKVQRLEYSLGKPKTLTASQVDEMNDVIEKNLPELSKHRNITSVQGSFKITNSTQIDKPCITIYVLGKGLIPFGESVFPNSFEGYPVDVVNGFWRRAGRFIDTSEGLIEGQEQNDVLKLGASIGVQGKEASGTLGAIVKSGGTYYALSCDHVMKSEETSIVHPGLYDHLKYLRYFLGEYKGCVDDVTGSETQCSVETLSSSQQLINKFEELRSIKEKNAISSRCTRANLKKIEKTERAFEEGREPPREIGEYVIGLSGNEKWTDDQKYFVDAAIAKLSDEEVEKLKESRSVRMFGTYIKPGSECCSATNQAILEAEKLCKSGRTTGYTEIGDKIIGSLQAPHFMVPPSYELRAPFVTVCASRYSCENCGGSGTAVTESEAPLRCDKCNQIEQTISEKLWFRRCLCIQQEMAKRFAGDGDSGSVIFQKIEKITPLGEKNVTLKGLGLLFGILEHQYHRYIMASPLQVVLDALSKDLPDGSGLKLVSEF